jgi:hypothetical protein
MAGDQSCEGQVLAPFIKAIMRPIRTAGRKAIAEKA